MWGCNSVSVSVWGCECECVKVWVCEGGSCEKYTLLESVHSTLPTLTFLLGEVWYDGEVVCRDDLQPDIEVGACEQPHRIVYRLVLQSHPIHWDELVSNVQGSTPA